MQGASDIFLGWDEFDGDDGVTRDFYFRQMWDWKLSADSTPCPPRPGPLRPGLRMGPGPGPRPLGRRHRHGPYLGSGARFDRAMCHFAAAYADQNERDPPPWPGHRRPTRCTPSATS